MSTESAAGEPRYELWIEDTIHPWHKDTITLAEIRQLGGIPADSPVSAIDLVTEQDVPLSEDSVHEIPPRDPGRPLVKRTQFKRVD